MAHFSAPLLYAEVVRIFLSFSAAAISVLFFPEIAARKISRTIGAAAGSITIRCFIPGSFSYPYGQCVIYWPFAIFMCIADFTFWDRSRL